MMYKEQILNQDYKITQIEKENEDLKNVFKTDDINFLKKTKFSNKPINRCEASYKCYLLGKQFLSFYKELYSQNSKNNILIEKMQYCYNIARNIQIIGYKKRINDNTLYDWFFLADSSLDSLFDDEIECGIYDLFVEKILDSDNVEEAFEYINSFESRELIENLRIETEREIIISQIIDIYCKIFKATFDCLINSKNETKNISNITNYFLFIEQLKKDLYKYQINENRIYNDLLSMVEMNQKAISENSILNVFIRTTYDDLLDAFFQIYQQYKLIVFPMLFYRQNHKVNEYENNVREVIKACKKKKLERFLKG